MTYEEIKNNSGINLLKKDLLSGVLHKDCNLCYYGKIFGGPSFLDFGECTHNNHIDNKNYQYSECPDFKLKDDYELSCMIDEFSHYNGRYNKYR